MLLCLFEWAKVTAPARSKAMNGRSLSTPVFTTALVIRVRYIISSGDGIINCMREN